MLSSMSRLSDKIPADEPPPPPPPTEEELELEREIGYLVDPPSLAWRQDASYGEASL